MQNLDAVAIIYRPFASMNGLACVGRGICEGQGVIAVLSNTRRLFAKSESGT